MTKEIGMAGGRPAVPSWLTGLSARLLVLTVFFTMLAEILIYVPSIARFRAVYLGQHIETARLATFALEAAPESYVAPELARELLETAGVVSIRRELADGETLILQDSAPKPVAASYDLSVTPPMVLIADAFRALVADTSRGSPERYIRVIGTHQGWTDLLGSNALSEMELEQNETIEIVLDQAPLQAAMYDYSARIVYLSIVISIIVASLVFLSCFLLMVRPVLNLTGSMIRFREAPDDPERIIAPSKRSDEVGVVERELAIMERDIIQALNQRKHLASLGAAVSKINHDLRNILASAQLVSDRLTSVEDPTVRRLTPTLISAIDRAITLCTNTLKYGRAEDETPHRTRFSLEGLLHDVEAAVGLPEDGRVAWETRLDADFEVDADRDHLYRILLNLGRNAVQAVESKGGGHVCIEARRADDLVTVEISDSGPGLPKAARDNLFKPFTGGARQGGTGLGLAISRDLVHAHGGRIELVKSDETGTCFRFTIPSRRMRKAG